MKEVLISIQPERVGKIINGEMSSIVQKTRPKIGTPFKCYICRTTEKVVEIIEEYDGNFKLLRRKKTVKKFSGEVIGEFVCDWITKITPYCDIDDCVNQYIHGYPAILGENDCLSFQEMKAYLGNENGYDWHISNLKIYDKPKELSDFCKPCKITPPMCDDRCEYYSDYSGVCMNYVNRPPQSWCYVEELEVE